MALTKVTGQVIKSDTNITSHNINSSGIITAVSFSGPFSGTGGNFTGIITASSATFSGNVTIGGTLTYEDVTNIDSLGIVTARNGLRVTAGGINVTAGVSTFSSLVDVNNRIDVVGGANIDQANITGILTATTLIGALTTTDACQVGDLTILNGNPDLRLKDSNHGGNNTEHIITFQDSSGNNQMNIGSPFGEQHLRIKYGTTDLVKIQTDGSVGIGTAAPNAPLQINHASPKIILEDNDNAADVSIANVGGAAVLSANSAITFQTADTSEKVRIDSSGRLIIGHTATDDRDGYNSALQVSGTGGDDSSVSIGRWSGDASASGLVLSKSRNGTIGSHTVLQADDVLGIVQFQGDDGSNYHVGADIRAIVVSGVGNDDMPADLAFRTNSGSTGTTEALRITSAGDVGINDSTPSFKLDVNGTGRFTDDLTINTTKKIKTNSSQGQLTIQPGPSYPGGSIKFAGGQSGATDRGTLIFYAGETTSLQERLRITSAGYVGINTTTPGRYLHIVGNDGATGATPGNSDSTMLLDNKGGNGAMIEFLGANTGAGHLMFTDTDGTNRGRFSYSHNTDSMRFDVKGQEALTLYTKTVSSTTSAVLGINDTSPATDALGLVVRNKGSQESALPVVLIQRDNNAGGGSSTDEIALKVNMPYTYNGAGDCYGIKSYAVHNLNSTHFAGHFEARGSQYDAGGDGAAVYATIHKTDTNGPGYVPAIYAYARSTFNIASTGYAVGMRIKLNAYEPNVGIMIHHELTNSNWTSMITFRKGSGANGSEVGSIKSSNNATQYNTSSDYRLKENVVDLTGAITRLKQLKPKRFNFKNDTSKTVDGFLAHEVETSCPQAVSGTKDAVKIETIANPETGKTIMNEDGTPKTETVIDPQEVDYSKLSTLTIAALQEALAKIETLEAKVAALEGS